MNNLNVRVISRSSQVIAVSGPRQVRLRSGNLMADRHRNKRFRLLLHDMKCAIGGSERRNLSTTLNPENRRLYQESERRERLNMGIGIAATGLAIAASAIPGLQLISVIAIAFALREVFRIVVRDFRNGRILSTYSMVIVRIVCLVNAGFLVLAGISGVISNFVLRIRRTAEGRSRQKLSIVFGELPLEARRKLGQQVEIIGIGNLKAGDLVIVEAGETIPVDGKVTSGHGRVDQHRLTGESQFVELEAGDRVLGTTLLLSGRMEIQVSAAGNDTVAARVGRLLSKTKGYTDNLILRGQRIADRFVPWTLGLAATTLLLLGPTPAIAVIMASIGGRMMLFGPLTVLNFLQIFARERILIKDGRVLECIGGVDTVVFDKTGTLTSGHPEVGMIHSFTGRDKNLILSYAAAAESHQSHPLANAIKARAKEKRLTLPKIEETSFEVGYGVKAKIDGKEICVGSERFMGREGRSLPPDQNNLHQALKKRGESLVYIAIEGTIEGAFQLVSSLRPESLRIVQKLKNRGIEIVILSGDHTRPTQSLAKEIGANRFFANTLPKEKADVIRRLQQEGKQVCFVGDGINDAIALKTAQVSVSISGASRAATDTAQVVLMDGSLENIPRLFELASEFEVNMKNNLRFSLWPGILTIGGIYAFNIGIGLSYWLNQASTGLGLANTMIPLVKNQRSNASKER